MNRVSDKYIFSNENTQGYGRITDKAKNVTQDE